MTTLRPDLPTLPERMRALPINEQGYPVPFFVMWVDGKPDFRVVDQAKLRDAVRFRLCWLCGRPLGRFMTYAIGPMCAVNRVSSEPPSHFECAEFAARACPFLTRPKAPRREGHMPEEVHEAAGVGLDRNPGVVLLWTTREPLRPYRVATDDPRAQAGVLFKVGEPTDVLWYAEGRAATRDEVLASFDGGCEILREMARGRRGRPRGEDRCGDAIDPGMTTGGLIEPELRRPACGASTARSEKRLVDRYADGRFLGWAHVRTYAHKVFAEDDYLLDVEHALALGAAFPPRP